MSYLIVILAIIAGGIAVWKTIGWANPSGASTATNPPTTGANPATGGTAGAPATPTAADIRAAAEAAIRQRVELRKIQLKTAGLVWKWVWSIGLLASLGFGIWAIWIRPQANGLTPSQEFVASSGASVTPPKVSYTFAAYKSGSNEEIRCRAWVLNEVRGDHPHMWFSVERFMQGRPVVVLYKWDGRKKAGTWEDEGDRTRGEFTGDIDPRDPNRFAGEIFAEGTTFRYFLQRKIE